MIIREMTVSNFFGFKQTQLALPETGIVVVQGKNGKGKTARTITAPSWIVWGETERGTPPYPSGTTPNVSGTIKVTTGKGHDLEITRTLKGNKKGVTFTINGEKQPDYSTVSKSEAALELLTGDYMSWRRTHVFSGADAAMFSHADDATRKRLLETMLALDIFDGPLSAAREQMRSHQQEAAMCKANVDRLMGQREQLLTHAKQVKQLIGTEVVDLVKLKADLASWNMRKRAILDEDRLLSQKVGSAQAQVHQLQSALNRIGTGKCHACGQNLPGADHAAHKKQAEAALAEAHEQFAQVRTDVTIAQRLLREEQAELDAKIQRAVVADAQAAKVREAEATLSRYREQLADLKQEIISYDAGRIDAEWQVEVMQHVTQVLSTKGVRSMLLGHALSSLTTLANAYLETLRPGISIDLQPTSETKGGKTVDAISLTINGMGGGWGYKATSGGERKRVDISLLLALAALANNNGTLIFDEAMDAVDDDGVAAVSALLMTVSQKRPVVIITHNAALAESLTGAQRIILK